MPKVKTTSEATGSKGFATFRKYLLPTLASLIVTAFVGDLLIKRNIEGFFAERRAFKEAPEKAKEDFAELLSRVNDMIRERQQSVLLINVYAGERDFENLLANYRDYEGIKDRWNAELDSVANAMRRITGCREGNGAGPFDDVAKSKILQEILDKADTLPAFGGGLAFPDGNVTKVSEKEFALIVKPGSFCPNYFLTDRRAGYNPQKATTRTSVREIFLSANSLIYQNVHSDTMKFNLMKEKLQDAALTRCVGSATIQEHIACVSEAIVAYRDVDCPHCREDELEFMSDRDFLEMDYRWYLGQQMLLAFQPIYIKKRCEEKIGFWGSLLGRSCDA
jgi:hypothetical protein